MIDPHQLHEKIEPFLKKLGEGIDATSVWMCHHNFEQRVSIVVSGCTMRTANMIESDEDIGAKFPETDGSQVWVWLRSSKPEPYVIHVDELARNDPDRLEYINGGTWSVLFLPVFKSGATWGYIEIWESREKRHFTAEDIRAAKAIIEEIVLLL